MGGGLSTDDPFSGSDESGEGRERGDRLGVRNSRRADGGRAVVRNGQQMAQMGQLQSQDDRKRLQLGFRFQRGLGEEQADFDRLSALAHASQPEAWDVNGRNGYDYNVIPQDKVVAGTILRRLQRSEERYKDATVAYFGQHGTWGYANLGDMDEKKLDDFAGRLAETGGLLLSARHSPETGYWNPSITTDETGKATITLTVPDRATAWKLSARGITAGDTLAGEGAATLTAKKDLFGELKLPLALVDGDEVELVATVHNDLIQKGTLHVTLKTTIGAWIH